METFESIFKRRSVRKYQNIPVEWELIGKVLLAGSKAPSAGNLQQTRAIVVLDQEKRKKIAEACLQQYWMATAPVHIVVCSDITNIKRQFGIRGERLYSIQDAAAFIENMLLAASDLGLGTCWVGAFDENAISYILGLPQNARCQAIITLGYPAEIAPEPPKFRLERFIYLESWGSRIKNVEVEVLKRWSPIVMEKTQQLKSSLSSAAQNLNQNIEKKQEGFFQWLSERFKDNVEKLKSKVKKE